MSDDRIIVIAGHAETSREIANEQPDHAEIWGINDGYEFMSRWDRWFLIDSPSQGGLVTESFEWAKTASVPVVMLDKHPAVPTSVRFPIREIMAKAELDEPYFTSSVSYMLALAAFEGADEIRLPGVNLANHSEYVMQRSCVEFWLGVAKGWGIKTWLPDSSPLLRGNQYGVQRVPGLFADRLQQMEHGYKARALESAQQYNTATGALTGWDRAMQVIEGVLAEVQEKAGAEMTALKEAQQTALAQINAQNGALQILEVLLQDVEGTDGQGAVGGIPKAMRSVRSIEEARERLEEVKAQGPDAGLIQ